MHLAPAHAPVSPLVGRASGVAAAFTFLLHSLGCVVQRRLSHAVDGTVRCHHKVVIVRYYIVVIVAKSVLL